MLIAAQWIHSAWEQLLGSGYKHVSSTRCIRSTLLHHDTSHDSPWRKLKGVCELRRRNSNGREKEEHTRKESLMTPASVFARERLELGRQCLTKTHDTKKLRKNPEVVHVAKENVHPHRNKTKKKLQYRLCVRPSMCEKSLRVVPHVVTLGIPPRNVRVERGKM